MSIYDTIKQELANFDLGVFSKEEQERRIAICRSCEEYSGDEEHKCNTCNCPINWRVMLTINSCPKGKWVGIDK